MRRRVRVGRNLKRIPKADLDLKSMEEEEEEEEESSKLMHINSKLVNRSHQLSSTKLAQEYELRLG